MAHDLSASSECPICGTDTPHHHPLSQVQRFRALENRVSRLTEALRKYGGHDSNCVGNPAYGKKKGRCNCGLDAALSEEGK